LKVLTTSLSDSSRAKFAAAGIEAIAAPVIMLRALPEQVARLKTALLAGRFRAIVFMSPRALGLIEPEQEVLAKIRTMKVFAVGPATENSLRGHGIGVCGLPDRFTSQSLLEMIKREGGIGTIAPIAVVRSALAGGAFIEGLRAAKIDGEEFKVYTATVDEGGAERFLAELPGAEVVVFTSRSSVELLADYAKMDGRLEETVELLRGKRLIAMGPETLGGIRRMGIGAEEADASTIEGIVQKINGVKTHEKPDKDRNITHRARQQGTLQ